MASLIVLGFEGVETAGRARERLPDLVRAGALDLADLVVVVRDASGKLDVRQEVSTARGGAFGGGLAGLLVGTLLLNPLAGLAVGAGAGALAGQRVDIGVPDDLVVAVGRALRPGTSALFALVRHADLEAVAAALAPLDPQLLAHNLSAADEAALAAAFAAQGVETDLDQAAAELTTASPPDEPPVPAERPDEV